MKATLPLSPDHQADLSPERQTRLRDLLVAEAHSLASGCAEREALINELRGLNDADSILERELAETGVARAQETLADIEHALHRLQGGTYGRCEACGLPIPFERLEAIPSARLCVACTGRRAGWPR